MAMEMAFGDDSGYVRNIPRLAESRSSVLEVSKPILSFTRLELLLSNLDWVD